MTTTPAIDRVRRETADVAAGAHARRDDEDSANYAIRLAREGRCWHVSPETLARVDRHAAVDPAATEEIVRRAQSAWHADADQGLVREFDEVLSRRLDG